VEYAEAFLRDQIPLPLRALIPTTLKQAYDAATLLAKGEPILNVISAQDNRGRVVQWAVDLGFQRLCESGQWPFGATSRGPPGATLKFDRHTR
jgi:hypothetical protein